MLQGWQKLLAKKQANLVFLFGVLLSTVDLFEMAWGGGAVYFIVTWVPPSVMGRGSNPLGLPCSSVLEFCKGMGFKKRSFHWILLLLCFKIQQLCLPLAMGQGCACEGSLYCPQSIAHGLFVAFLEDRLFQDFCLCLPCLMYLTEFLVFPSLPWAVWIFWLLAAAELSQFPLGSWVMSCEIPNTPESPKAASQFYSELFTVEQVIHF